MRLAVVRERDQAVREWLAVQLHADDASLNPLRVRDLDVVARRAVVVAQAEAGPLGGDARADPQPIPDLAEAQERLDAGAVVPRRRAGVPRPAAPANVWR